MQNDKGVYKNKAQNIKNVSISKQGEKYLQDFLLRKLSNLFPAYVDLRTKENYFVGKSSKIFHKI